MAEIHLCPTLLSAENLYKENVTSGVHVVGNTVLDNLSGVDPIYGNTILVTMHRRENHELMDQWFHQLETLAVKHPEYEFVIPLHPNPNVQQYRHILKKVKTIDPVNHAEFIRMIAACRFIITDSGGIQEEASFLGKKCIVCRQITERVEGMGIFSFMCPTPSELSTSFNWMNTDNNHQPAPGEICPYGDGKSAIKIASILQGIT
jgi:UDP-N-acetylglucosamine 2-epimerase (non-hydrolysing)